MRPEHLIPLLAYLLGSIPFGYLLIKSSEGGDIRSFGSGNIGFTNVFRKSRWAGILTLVLDLSKGYMAVVAAGWLSESLEWQAVAAFAAIVGHIFPVWLRFKGGKGVATFCGACLALSPLAMLTALGLFLLILILTRYMSLASIAVAALYPFWAYIYNIPMSVIFWAAAGSLLIIVKHHQNIRRLLSGNESKFMKGIRS